MSQQKVGGAAGNSNHVLLARAAGCTSLYAFYPESICLEHLMQMLFDYGNSSGQVEGPAD